MPTSPARARWLLKVGKAKKRFTNGILYLQLIKRNSGEVQEVSCGIDSGSKREGITVKSEKKTFINILADAKTSVKNKIEIRRSMRRTRRNRKTPCRKNKPNRACLKKEDRIPPSTLARWQSKLRIINILRKIYPISIYVIEDVKAKTKKGNKIHNKNFSPIEVGKKWFYDELKKHSKVLLKEGHETAQLREKYNLQKTKDKLSESFDAHNVDSWVLAHSIFDYYDQPDNKDIFRFKQLEFYRRQLHVFQPSKGGIRRLYGSTLSLGIVRGTVVRHKKYGYCYVGGNSKNRISIHNLETGKRLAQNIKIRDIEEMYKQKWIVSQIRDSSNSSPA